MSDLEKILVAAAVSFGFGFLSGILLEKYREQKRIYEAVLAEYLKGVSAPGVNENEYLRFAALQRAGAWRLSFRELRKLADEVVGRGLLHPFSAWREIFPEDRKFPTELLTWAKRKSVDFSQFDEAMHAVAEEFSARKLPRPPEAGVVFLQ
jgi:hypothetical protein